MQMFEHTLAMGNVPRAQTAGVGPVETGWVRLETHAVERCSVIPAPRQGPGQRKANDHEDDTNRMA